MKTYTLNPIDNVVERVVGEYDEIIPDVELSDLLAEEYAQVFHRDYSQSTYAKVCQRLNGLGIRVVRSAG
ncbi:MAG TPA: hypothetical protein VFA52_04240 [Candidatus Paceibacterota bacterium]|jgi:hypothetical protein|nr:hypothetical protein [Candidatus Paceibacterota bacterium]